MVQSSSLLPSMGYRWKHLLYIPVGAISCLVAVVVTHYAFAFDYHVSAWFATFVLLAPFFVLIAPALRSFKAGFALNLLITHLLLASHAIKLIAMKTPINAADLKAVSLLLATLSGPYQILAIVLISCLLGLLVISVALRRQSLPGLLLAGAYVAALLLTTNLWVERASTYLGTHQREASKHAFNLTDRRDEQMRELAAQGGVLFILNDWIALKRDIGFIPTRTEVAAIKVGLWRRPGTRPTRNVHMVLLESIWDSRVLDRVSVTGDPIDQRFMALWQQAGMPHALSPVLGGMTANAEFEALCGLQAPSNSIAFLDSLQQPTPCLPALFQRMGYHTMASHPHESTNWGRNRAYSLIGFEEFSPIDAFELDDMDGDFLADHSMFRQNLTALQSAPKSPIFNYVVTLSSHWAYIRDIRRRPDKVAVSPSDLKLLPAYLNSSAYTTSAFMDWAEQVIARDPDALIIAFGDHAPVLDGKPDVYSWLTSRIHGNFESSSTRQLVGMARVPLLVIDGKEGALRLPDDIPMYELPTVVGSKVGLGQLPLPQSRTPLPGVVVRTWLGQLLARVDGRWLECGKPDKPVHSADCDRAWRRQWENRVLRQDLVAGNDYLLQMVGGSELTQKQAPLRIIQTHESCSFKVAQWGPSEAELGQPFNATSLGESSVWMTFERLRGAPTVQIGDVPAHAVRGDKLITASAPTKLITAKAGEIPIWLRCADEPRVRVGTLRIH